MKDRRPGSPSRGRRRTGRPGFRLGIGAGEALAKLAVAALLSVLLGLAIADRWNVIALVVIGFVWAFVFAGLIVVPVVASFIADSLGQHRSARPFSPPDQGYDVDSWAPEGPPPAYPPPPPNLRRATGGLEGMPLVVGMSSGFDWAGLIDGVASRLETALGDGYAARAEGSALVLRYGPMVRKVNLRSLLQPPPLEVSERALRGCLKMMDEAQMFSMRVRQGPWPSREGSPGGAPGNLPRPRVRLDDGEIRMVWADSSGTVLRLRPLPFYGGAVPRRDGT